MKRKQVSGSIDPRFACFRLSVGHSRVHGRGIFSGETIPAGRKVIEYTGERISRREHRRRFLKAWRSGDRRIYVVRLNLYWALDGSRGGSGAELVNHSCEPNLRWERTGDHLYYVSRRKIRRGEELTVDYAFPADGPKVPCRCGARTCRGNINVR